MQAGRWPAMAMAALALNGAAPPTAVPVRGHGLCRAGERVLFTCGIGVRTASVCADAAMVQYRFGRPGRLELVYPDGAGTLTHASIPFAGGGEDQIGFTRDGVRYVVYSRAERRGFGRDGHNDELFSAGVMAYRGDRLIAQRTCTDPPDAILDAATAGRLLPAGRPSYLGDAEAHR